MTSTRRRPGNIYAHYDGNIDLDVYGGLFLAHFGANGQASTTLDLSGNNFLKIIDDENGDFFGMLMNFSLRPWRMILNCWFTTSGLTLVLDGNRNHSWQFKLFLKNMGMIGWIVVSMDVAMAWLMHIKTFCGKSGWWKQTMFHSQFRCKVCQGGHCHGRLRVVKLRSQAITPGRWSSPLLVFGQSRLWTTNNYGAWTSRRLLTMRTLTSMRPLLMEILAKLWLVLNLLHQILRMNRPMLQNVNVGRPNSCTSTKRLATAQVATLAELFVMPIWTNGRSRWLRTSLVQFVKVWNLVVHQAATCHLLQLMLNLDPGRRLDLMRQNGLCQASTKRSSSCTWSTMPPSCVFQCHWWSPTASIRCVLKALPKWLRLFPRAGWLIIQNLRWSFPTMAWASWQKNLLTSAATRTLSSPCQRKKNLGLMDWLRMQCGSSNIPQRLSRWTTLPRIHLWLWPWLPLHLTPLSLSEASVPIKGHLAVPTPSVKKIVDFLPNLVIVRLLLQWLLLVKELKM